MTGQERPAFQQQLLAQEPQRTLPYGEGGAVRDSVRSRIHHFFPGSASGHIYTAQHGAAQRYSSCLETVIALVSQQD